MSVDVERTNSTGRQSMERETVVQLNNLIDDLRVRSLPGIAATVGTTTDITVTPFCFVDELGSVLCTLTTIIATIPTVTITDSGGGFGIMNIVVDSGTGVVSMTVHDATQTVLTTRALALAEVAAPAAGTQLVAVMLIETDGSDWVANTDSFVKGDDLTDFDLIHPNASELPAAIRALVPATLPSVGKITDRTLEYLQ